MEADDYFTHTVADYYDQDHSAGNLETLDTAVSVLKDLTAGGPALEFAIGTGRIAIPLVEQGVEVSGIELSQAMVDKLRAKEDGSEIPVTIGDMATTVVEGGFSLVFLVFNTFSNLVSQEAQLSCFKNAAAHLQPGGRFLVENAVPPLQRLPVGETRLAFDRTEHHWGIDEIDVVSQQCTSHHVWMDDGGVRHFSLPFRYVWPSELDLMAHMAGLVLEHRWASWDRATFTCLSNSHISVWRKEDG